MLAQQQQRLYTLDADCNLHCTGIACVRANTGCRLVSKRLTCGIGKRNNYQLQIVCICTVPRNNCTKCSHFHKVNHHKREGMFKRLCALLLPIRSHAISCVHSLNLKKT